jgi:hypothetical protein
MSGFAATSSAEAGPINPTVKNSEEKIVTKYLTIRTAKLLICSLFKVTRVTSGTKRLTLS